MRSENWDFLTCALRTAASSCRGEARDIARLNINSALAVARVILVLHKFPRDGF